MFLKLCCVLCYATVTDKDHDSFKQKTNLALMSLNQWVYINHLVLNITETNVIKLTHKTTAHVPLDIYYKEYCMFLNKELNSHFKSRYSAYGLLRILSFSTSIWNNLLEKFNTCASSI